MAFFDNKDQQVRLRFSRYTNEVLQHDRFMFGEPKENTFINTIIRNFYETADASIHMRLEQYKSSLEDNLSGMAASSASTFKNQLIDIERNRLISIASGYDAPDSAQKSKPYRLQNDIYKELTDPASDFQENIYYNDSRSAYLRTLIEEYSHLPYIRRERIYYKNIFAVIEEAVAQGKTLLITVASGRSYHTLPYRIMSDPLSTVHYLAGFSYPLDGEKSDKYTVSYKIASIRNIRIEKSRSGYLHPEDKALLNKAIAEKGVQFLVSEEDEIHVRFTEEGRYAFEHWLHLRPTPISMVKEKDSYLAVFHCSLEQASAYFFKFGAKAEILSPQSLRDKFAAQYQDAAGIYSQT